VKTIFLKLLEDKGKKKKVMNLDCGEYLHQMTINVSCKNREYVIQEICNCIYGNALPFNLVRSPLFIQMLKAVEEYGKGLNPSSYHEVRVSI